MDAQCLEQVTRDLPIITKNVEALKADHKNHQRLLHEFTMKQQERMMQPWGMMPPRHPGGYPQPPPGAPGAPGGMMRMRAPFPRSMDPRQIEFERMHHQRLQMMHGAGHRPPPPQSHHMHRAPAFMEVSNHGDPHNNT